MSNDKIPATFHPMDYALPRRVSKSFAPLLVLGILGAGCLGLVGGYVAGTAEPHLIPAVTVTENPEREAMTTTEEEAFDRGFAAGQEYEEWFCSEGEVLLP